MNIKVTMSKLQNIIKEELDMIDVSDDIVEEREFTPRTKDEKARDAYRHILAYIREHVYSQLSETESSEFGKLMYEFFKTYAPPVKKKTEKT